MSRLLVTGGAGFIGANFVRYWLDRYPDDAIFVLDALTYAGNLQSLSPVAERSGFTFVQGDIRDQKLVQELLQDERIETIVHFAAESHVDRSIAGPDVFLDVNILGVHSLLKAARESWADREDSASHRFHNVSTDEVYGSLDMEAPAFREVSPFAPNSPYAATKAAADHLVRAYWKTYDVPSTISNCSNNYGPHQYPEKLIPLAITNLLLGKEVPIYGDGRNVRDWIFVEDHCEGIDRVLKQGQVGRTYNLGGDAERSNVELIRELCDLIDRAFAGQPDLAQRFPEAWPVRGRSCSDAVVFVRDRPGHDRRYAIDGTRVKKELGFVPATEFSSGLERTLRWYLDHEEWWRSVMDGSYRAWIGEQYADG